VEKCIMSWKGYLVEEFFLCIQLGFLYGCPVSWNTFIHRYSNGFVQIRPPSRVKVMNEWGNNLQSLTCLHGLHKENVTSADGKLWQISLFFFFYFSLSPTNAQLYHKSTVLYTPDQHNSNVKKGNVYAATNTYWLHKRTVTPKRFYSIL
jgi:hypothetical protein